MFLIFAGIFIPDTRRYYMSSHSGLWRICRNSLVPLILAQSSAARNFTTLSLNNLTLISQLKSQESKTAYFQTAIENFDLNEPINEIDDNFRRALFAHWLKNDSHFSDLKSQFHKLVAKNQVQEEVAQTRHEVVSATGNSNLMLLNPMNVSAVKETIGAALSTIFVNGTYVNVIVPEALRNALFNDWEEKSSVLQLMWAFAKDMEVSIAMTNSNGTTRYIIQPPPPPRRGKTANGYEYKPFRK